MGGKGGGVGGFGATGGYGGMFGSASPCIMMGAGGGGGVWARAACVRHRSAAAAVAAKRRGRRIVPRCLRVPDGLNSVVPSSATARIPAAAAGSDAHAAPCRSVYVHRRRKQSRMSAVPRTRNVH